MLERRVTTCLENLKMLGEFDVRDLTKSHENVRKKILSGKSCLKLFYCMLHICIHTGI